MGAEVLINAELQANGVSHITGEVSTTAPIVLDKPYLNITGDNKNREQGRTVVYCDHDGPAVIYDKDAGARQCAIDGVQFRRRSASDVGWHQSYGVEMRSATDAFARGLTIRRSAFKYFEYGYYDAADTGSFVGLHMSDSSLHNNSYGLYSKSFLIQSYVRDCDITANWYYGILTGGKGLEVRGNDFEGQPWPLRISGTNNTCIVIEGNYFEANRYEEPEKDGYCVALSLTHGFRIGPQQFSNSLVGSWADPSKLILFAGHCDKGSCDVPRDNCDFGQWPETNVVAFNND